MTSSNWLSHFIFLFLIHFYCFDSARAGYEKAITRFSRNSDSVNCSDIMESKMTHSLVNIKTADGKYLDTFYDRSKLKTFLVVADKSVTVSQIWSIRNLFGIHIIFPFQDYSEAVHVNNKNASENGEVILRPVDLTKNQRFIYQKGMLKSVINENMTLTVPSIGSSDENHRRKVFLKYINKQCNQKWKIVPVEDSYLGLIDNGNLLSKPVVIKNALGYYLDVKYSFSDKIYYLVANGNIRKAGPLWKIVKSWDNKLYIEHIGINERISNFGLRDIIGTELITLNLNALKFIYDGGVIKSAVNENLTLTAVTDSADNIGDNERSFSITFQENNGQLNQKWSIFDAEAEYGSLNAVQDEVSGIKITAFQAALIMEEQYSSLIFESRINKKANLTTYVDEQYINMSIDTELVKMKRELKSASYKFELEKFAVLFKIDVDNFESFTEQNLTFYADINGRNFLIEYKNSKTEFGRISCNQNKKTIASASYGRFTIIHGIIEAKNEFVCLIEGKVMKFSFQVLTMKPEIELFEYNYFLTISSLTCKSVDTFLSETEQNISIYHNENLLTSSNISSAYTNLHNSSGNGTYKCVYTSELGTDEVSFKVTEHTYGNYYGILNFIVKPYSKSVKIASTFHNEEFSCKQGNKQMSKHDNKQMIFTWNLLTDKFHGMIHASNEFTCNSTGDTFQFEVFV